MRLLLVEDSTRLQELLAEALNRAGYGLDAVATVADLFRSVAAVQYDLIIIDLGLPDGDGLDAIRSLRSAKISVPILVITARGSVEDRVGGLDSGADDYLTKPFNNAELLARVRALLRRPTDFQGAVLRVGKTELDEAAGQVRCSGSLLDLRLSERRLLAVLMRRSGNLVAKAVLEETLSEAGRELTANAVEVLVSRLRKALGEAASGIKVETVRGIGYQLRVEEEA
jgi:two-component system, OmpR family, response regulator